MGYVHLLSIHSKNTCFFFQPGLFVLGYIFLLLFGTKPYYFFFISALIMLFVFKVTKKKVSPLLTLEFG